MSRKQSVFAPQINSLALDTVLVCLKKKQDYTKHKHNVDI